MSAGVWAGRLAAGLLATALLAGCSSSDGQEPPGPAPSTPTTARTPTPSLAPTPAAPPSADEVRSGTALHAGSAHAWVMPAADVRMTKRTDDDGSVHLTFRDARADAAGAPVAYLTGSGITVLGDGSTLVGGGGITPADGRLAETSPDVLALTAGGDDAGTTVWFAGDAVAKTSWGNREGGRSLAVTPTAWARNGGLAAQQLTWAQLTDSEPDADSPSMHDQLTCHELGAPDKATWNLEPWRPQVDGLAMLAARCNPT